MGFKIANEKSTKRFETEEGDYIVVRAEISKQEHINLTRGLTINASGDRNIDEVLTMQDNLFQLLVLEWSVKDNEGNDVPVSVEAYHNLDLETSSVIDKWLQEHMAEKFGREVEELEGEATG